MVAFKKSKVSKIVGFLLTVVISLTIGNRILFTHVHILPNGHQVTHAHPFNQKDEPDQQTQHTHSNTELFFIMAMGVLFFGLLVIPNTGMLNPIRVLRCKHRNGIRMAVAHAVKSRAPPSFI